MKPHATTPPCSRRKFLSGCAACAGGMLLGPKLSRAGLSVRRSGMPKIRLVFCEVVNDVPIWPNIGYDFDARRERMLKLLTNGCPDVEFLVTRLMDGPTEADGVLEKNGEVDGYLICVQGLGWRNDIVKLCATGKPTLLVDNLFGGSGLFLDRQPRIMGKGNPVDWVSSSDDDDIVGSALSFALLAEGKSGAEVAAAFRASRRENTPEETDWACARDEVRERDFEEALEELAQKRILVVGGGWGGDEFRGKAKALLGCELKPIDFKELKAAHLAADLDEAKAVAARWMETAQEVVEPEPAEIEKSASIYLGMKQLIEQHGAHGISVNCLGGFYGGHLSAYPCLGFAQLNDDGLVGGCEADQMSALTMATIGSLAGRPGFISDPVIDTSRNEIIYAHCVAMTRPFGTEGPMNPFRIRNHSEDRKGASIQSLLPAGYLTTTLEINLVTRQVLFHQAKTTSNNDSDMACRTKLAAAVKGDIEKLTEEWRMGWHRVTFYGDLRPQVVALCDRFGLELIEEA
ncbi:MAG: hypothetical protein V2A76_00625 [Planctomycetota bacterium]